MHPWRQPPRALMVLLLIVVIIGSLLRFTYLDQKVYWHDEVTSSYRIAGYRGGEIQKQLYTGELLSVADLQRYQQVTPDVGLADLLDTIVVENPQHAPLYYILLQQWAKLWGNASITTLRSLSALLSLLTYPAVYWLCQELFAPPSAPVIGWMAMAVISISPFHLLYAQEARPYSLWMVITVFSTAALLRAVRLKTPRSWLVYLITMALGFYTFLLSAFVVLAQGLYLVCLRRRCLRAYLLAVGGAVLLFSPWIWVLVSRFHSFRTGAGWLEATLPLPELVSKWGRNLGSLIFDWGLAVDQPLTQVIALITTLALGYLLWRFWCQAPRQASLMVLLLIVIPPLLLVGPDLLLGGQRSAHGRYFVPSFAGWGIAIAYTLATPLVPPQGRPQPHWKGITALLLTAQLVACLHLLPAQHWWNKWFSWPAATLINQSSQPLVLTQYSGSSPGHLIALSYRVKLEAKFILITTLQDLTIPSGFSDIFFFDISPVESSELYQQYQTQLKPVSPYLWKFKTNPPQQNDPP